MDKDQIKKEFLKVLYKRFISTPDTTMKWRVDHSAIELIFSTPLAKLHIRIYEDKIIILTNHRTEYAKQFDTFNQEEITAYIDEILQDASDRF